MTINSKEPQRQIPRTKKYTASKLYYDQVYGYLQNACRIDPETKRKIIDASVVNYSEIGQALGITRQTTSKKFNNLIELGLVVPAPEGYELITLPNQDAFLVSLTTLRKLISSVKERTISIYIYLLNRFIANQEQPFDFTLTGLKDYVGMSPNNRNNNYIITDILDVLQELSLIKYSVQTEYNENGLIKTTFTLLNATNKLPNENTES